MICTKFEFVNIEDKYILSLPTNDKEFIMYNRGVGVFAMLCGGVPVETFAATPRGFNVLALGEVNTHSAGYITIQFDDETSVDTLVLNRCMSDFYNLSDSVVELYGLENKKVMLRYFNEHLGILIDDNSVFTLLRLEVI
jgi:hypothetical protein